MNARRVFLSIALAPVLAVQGADLFIVSLGDSYASGEGNPNSGSGLSATWTNSDCHRSLKNGRRFASDRINDMTGFTTTFRDYSCSGATTQSVGGGQLTNAKNAQTALNRTIDILMLSVGGNNVDFGKVVQECMLPNDCRNSAVVNAAINKIAQLGGNLDDLREKIEEKLNVNHVYITDYPNPVKNNNGDWCGGFDDFFVPAGDWAGAALKGLSAQENSFLLTNYIQPLNDAIGAFVVQHPNWHFVKGTLDTFRPHGYCQPLPLRWIHTLGDSFTRQGDYKGVFHPNVAGHQAYADALVRRATFDFDLPLETPKIQDIDIVNRDWEDNIIALPNYVKRVRAEVNQVPGSLSVVLQSRIRRPFDGDGPGWTNTSMQDGANGALNRMFDDVPGSGSFWSPVDKIEYRVKVTQTRSGQSKSTTSQIRSLMVGDVMPGSAEIFQ